MPKDLFFAIGDDKQSRIIDAALHEFSSQLYHDASINQIIQEANISRGSFYKYFEDKDDLYFFITNRIIKTTAHSFLKDFTKKRPVDVLSVYKELFKFNLKFISEGKYKAFFENMYLSMNYQMQQKLKRIFGEIRNEMLENQMNDVMRDSGYEEKFFLELMNILELINRDLLMMKIANHLDDQSVLEMYDLRIHVLCSGILHDKAKSKPDDII